MAASLFAALQQWNKRSHKIQSLSLTLKQPSKHSVYYTAIYVMGWIRIYTPFSTGNNVIRNTWLKLAKIKLKLSNTLRVNFFYLKSICYLHPSYHIKVIRHILKKRAKKQVCLFQWDYIINYKKMKIKITKDHIDTT